MAVDDAKVTLVAIMKDERPYILEWVAYHRLIGFSDIVIYSNDSTDGSLEMLDALHRAGILTHRIQKTNIGVSPQLAAYKDAAIKCKTEWIAVLDADEFLVLKADAKVDDFLNRFRPEVSGIAINWRIFGSAGKLALEPGLVIERFTRASEPNFSVNCQVKSIVRVRDIAEILVHGARLRQGQYVNSSGDEVPLISLCRTPSVVTDIAQINHYYVKSIQEFERKRRRGRADFPPEHPELYTTRSDGILAGHDRNEEEDLTLYKFRGEVAREIDRLQKLIEVAPAARSVLLLGFSHVVALRIAQSIRITRGAASFNLFTTELLTKYKTIVTPRQGRHVLHESIEPDLQQAVEELQPKLILGSFWGDQHFFMSTANLPRRLDFVLPSEPDLPLDANAEVVPYDLVYGYMRAICRYQDLLIEATRRASPAPLYLIKAPPPVFDFSAIPGGSSSASIDKLVAEHGLSPPLLRYKFWRLVDSIYEEIAAETGVTALPVPPEALQPNGFRRAEYYSTDWIHGNPAYGELVLGQIDALSSPN